MGNTPAMGCASTRELPASVRHGRSSSKRELMSRGSSCGKKGWRAERMPRDTRSETALTSCARPGSHRRSAAGHPGAALSICAEALQG